MCLPDIQADPRPLYDMLFAETRTQLLMAGIRLRIFNQLQTPDSAAGLAGRLELDPVNTGLFLNGLAALGLLNKEQGIFSNTLMAKAFLIPGCPSYLGNSFLMQREMKDMTVDDLENMVSQIQDSGELLGADGYGYCTQVVFKRLFSILVFTIKTGIC